MSSQYTYIFTVLASTEGFLVVSGLILLSLLLRRNFRAAGLFLLTTIGAAVSTQLLKEYFMVARPENAPVQAAGYAFPSGHAMGAMYLALFAAYAASVFTKPIRYGFYLLAAGFALGIGMSRLQLGVHTPVQVFAGYAVAVFWVGVYIFCVDASGIIPSCL
tara:strand:- start:315386 stop:315868 length:483 start_codon:yes stop_codon:yes gene_type:complete